MFTATMVKRDNVYECRFKHPLMENPDGSYQLVRASLRTRVKAVGLIRIGELNRLLHSPHLWKTWKLDSLKEQFSPTVLSIFFNKLVDEDLLELDSDKDMPKRGYIRTATFCIHNGLPYIRFSHPLVKSTKKGEEFCKYFSKHLPTNDVHVINQVVTDMNKLINLAIYWDDLGYMLAKDELHPIAVKLFYDEVNIK